jgi:hypothetical protein
MHAANNLGRCRTARQDGLILLVVLYLMVVKLAI